MQEYQYNTKTYIDITDIRREFKSTYCKGIRSNLELLKKKDITDFVYGRIIDGEFCETEKLSRKLGSIYINKEALSEIFKKPDSAVLQPAPLLIEDQDLVFFKDDNGISYQAEMRGKRTKNDILFSVNSIMDIFQMPNLKKCILQANSAYKIGKHYTFFNMSDRILYANEHNNIKEMYLSYNGLRRVIDVSQSGIGYKFKTYIDDIVFGAMFGNQEQKIEIVKKIINVDADHLKSIMSKSASDIICLYLINTGILNGDNKVYKYGLTNDVQRRFREHIKHYGDNITLDTFILIPGLNLSKAETEFKQSVSRYKYDKESEQELISICSEAYLNVKTIFRTISEKHCGNMSTQIAQYESEIKDLKHAYEMQIIKLTMTIESKDLIIESKEKDNENLRLQLQLADLKLQLAQK